MKRTILLLSVLCVGLAAVAQEPADHPVIGRYQGSTVNHQEVSTFGRYEVLVAPGETRAVEGEVWMTLYSAPDDASTYTVHSTYRDYLQSAGFTILVNCPPGECGSDVYGDVYGRAPFADNGNYSYSAPITNGNPSAFCLLTASRESPEQTLYVSIAIAAGWYAYPQYKVDVVEIKSNAGAIVSSGTPASAEPATDRETAPADQATAALDARGAADTTPAADAGAPAGVFLSGYGSFRARGGYAGILLLDPAFAGGFITYHNEGSYSTSVSGFRNLHGPFGEITWFPNRNLGFLINAGMLSGDTEFTVDGTDFESDAEMIMGRAGFVARMVGADYPTTLSLGFSGGISVVRLYQSWSTDSDGQYLILEDFYPLVCCAAQFSVPLPGPLSLTAGAEYLFVPATTMRFVADDSDSDEYLEYREPNLGGLVMQIGLEVEL